ncbi:MAG: GntR family transcriptional regulator [Maritimibacter sp.]
MTTKPQPPAIPPADPGLAAHEHVYRTLRLRIMYGEMEPGTALTLRGIGKEFGVSMTPAREAVRRLAAEGALMLSASGRVSTPDLGPERIEELATIRALLEPELSSRALPRPHMALIERLRAINPRIGEHIAKRMRALYTARDRSDMQKHHRMIISALAAGDEPGLRLAIRTDVTQGLKMLVG